MVVWNVRLEQELVEQLKALAAKNDRTASAEVRRAIKAHLGKKAA
jgi:predicted DNA-binding protein